MFKNGSVSTVGEIDFFTRQKGVEDKQRRSEKGAPNFKHSIAQQRVMATGLSCTEVKPRLKSEAKEVTQAGLGGAGEGSWSFTPRGTSVKAVTKMDHMFAFQ